MSRVKLFLIWILCVIVSPLVFLGMLGYIIFGTATQALNTMVEFDEVGGFIISGQKERTVSAYTGLAESQGKIWAVILGNVIDLMFGKGHCLNAAKKEGLIK
jgi:hypothetical protein